jgi:hypothetical protein
MVNSVSSTGTTSTYQTNTDDELTQEQKRKIAEIKADYDAKKITYAEEQKKIADVKASGVKAKKKDDQQKAQDSAAATKVEAKTTATKAQPASAAKLQELLKKKDADGKESKEVSDFIGARKDSSDTEQGTLVDETV